MTKHPAKFTDVLLREIEGLLAYYVPLKILDPFAGTGRVHLLDQHETYGVEIEPEWATMHPRTIQGDAHHLPFKDEVFDVIVTSPCYGNRMADHHNAKDGSRRMTYKHVLGRDLHPNSSGKLQWGRAYREFHMIAWMEAERVLRPGGRFILNCSNHIRKGEVQPVTEWHIAELEDWGFTVREHIKVPTPRMRGGENHELRVEHESIVVLDKAA